MNTYIDKKRVAWNKGKVGCFSDSTKLKMSLARKGKKASKETRKKISIYQKGKIVSEETRQRMIKNHVGTTGKKLPHSKEVIEKIRQGNTGKIRTPEQLKRLSDAHIGKNKGEKHGMWNGGSSLEGYTTDWTDSLRTSIRERDGYMCQECGVHQDELIGKMKKLSVHHIDYNKENLDPNNLITLCNSCHVKTNFNREYWTNYFNK